MPCGLNKCIEVLATRDPEVKPRINFFCPAFIIVEYSVL